MLLFIKEYNPQEGGGWEEQGEAELERRQVQLTAQTQRLAFRGELETASQGLSPQRKLKLCLHIPVVVGRFTHGA